MRLSNSRVGELGAELADVLIYVASIANREDIDLGQALRDKERLNEQRTWLWLLPQQRPTWP